MTAALRFDPDRIALLVEPGDTITQRIRPCGMRVAEPVGGKGLGGRCSDRRWGRRHRLPHLEMEDIAGRGVALSRRLHHLHHVERGDVGTL